MHAFDEISVALPFHNNSGSVLPTTGFEEAVARLLFVAERNWPAAWLRGTAGCGKTTVLAALAMELKRANRRVVSVSLETVPEGRFWNLLALALGDRNARNIERSAQNVRDLITNLCRWEQPPVLLLDDFDLGNSELVQEVALLIRMSGSPHPPLTVIIATTDPILPSEIASRIDLRTQVSPFTREETGRFLQMRLEETQKGGRLEFTADAVDALHELTSGVPAAIIRLGDLAIVAAYAHEAKQVSAEFVRCAAMDLTALPATAARKSGIKPANRIRQ